VRLLPACQREEELEVWGESGGGDGARQVVTKSFTLLLTHKQANRQRPAMHACDPLFEKQTNCTSEEKINKQSDD
jgi:hypothetical protein